MLKREALLELRAFWELTKSDHLSELKKRGPLIPSFESHRTDIELEMDICRGRTPLTNLNQEPSHPTVQLSKQKKLKHRKLANAATSPGSRKKKFADLGRHALKPRVQ